MLKKIYEGQLVFLNQLSIPISLTFSRRMGSNTLVITKMIKSMGGENTHTQMEISIMVIGKMAYGTEKGNALTRKMKECK